MSVSTSAMMPWGVVVLEVPPTTKAASFRSRWANPGRDTAKARIMEDEPGVLRPADARELQGGGGRQRTIGSISCR